MPPRRIIRTSVLIAMIAGAAWLRFHAIAAKSFWIDEGASVTIARMDWFNFARLLWRREANMTLYYLLLRGWVHLGESETFIRALSIVFALATIPILYLLGKRLFGRRPALVACVLLAVNAFHVRYSQEARAYTLVVFLVTLASLLFVEANQRPTHFKWTAYAVVAALAVYAQFYAVLVVVAHAVWWWKSGPAELNRQFRNAIIVFAALTAPIWIFIVTTGAGPLRWLERPGLGALREFILAMTGNGGWLLALLYIALGVGGIAGPRVRHMAGPFRIGSGGRFAAAWLLVPVVVTLAVSLIKPVFLPRYLIICLPALVLLAGAGIMRLGQTAATALLIGITALSLQGTADYYKRDFDLLREDWRGATAYVLEHQEQGDAILFHANQGRMPFEYYTRLWQRHEPTVYFPGSPGEVTWRDFMGAPARTKLDEAAARPRAWLVLSHTSEVDPATHLAISSLEGHYSKSAVIDFQGVRVWLYSR